jgi:hypothetical protein
MRLWKPFCLLRSHPWQRTGLADRCAVRDVEAAGFVGVGILDSSFTPLQKSPPSNSNKRSRSLYRAGLGEILCG